MEHDHSNLKPRISNMAVLGESTAKVDQCSLPMEPAAAPARTSPQKPPPEKKLVAKITQAPSVIADQHQGSKSDFGGEVDVEQAIELSGCSLDYYELEECLGEHDRDWRKCQKQV